MKISSLTLQNFRCFGPDPVTVSLSDLTAFVGANGAGKSAVLEALVRLFGASASDRRLVRSDFHLPADQAADDVDEASLLIEARLDFPELEEGADGDAVPECFNQMTVAGENGALYCRVRLEATWRRTSSPEGEIEEPVYWIKTDAAQPADDDKVAMQNFDRSRIRVIYVPAARDPIRQMRQVSGSLLYRLLRAVNWSDAVREAVDAASEQLRTAFRGEAGVGQIEQAIAGVWRALHTFRAYSEVGIQPVGGRFEDLLRKVEVAFRPGEGGVEQGIDRLSDGLKSLFYFSLVGATFDIEQAARAGGVEILADELHLPTLTMFAIEEAENHLAPHYLGRILKLLRRMGESPNAQVVLTSQSPAILARVDPETVRHFRLDAESQTTIVRPITLPSAEGAGEAYKYVKEAVRAEERARAGAERHVWINLFREAVTRGLDTKAIPSLRVRAALHAAIRMDDRRPLRQNDLEDIAHSSVAVSYSAAFLTERSFAELLNRSPVQSAIAPTKCRVVSNVGDALAAIAEMISD